jgi:hypothetical protein
MNKLLKLTFYLSIFTIIVWLIRPILFWIIGLEFADSEFEMSYSYSWRFILPVAICLTISKEFIDGLRPQSLMKSILIRIGLSALSVFIVFMSLFTNMCGWIEKDVYFESKHNSGKIALMEYGCGAYDSDPNPRQEIKIIKPWNKLFNWSNTCDTTAINKNEWTKIN